MVSWTLWMSLISLKTTQKLGQNPEQTQVICNNRIKMVEKKIYTALTCTAQWKAKFCLNWTTQTFRRGAWVMLQIADWGSLCTSLCPLGSGPTRAHLRAHQGTSQGPPGHISGPTRAHLRAHQGTSQGPPGHIPGPTRAHLRAHQGTSQGPPGHISGPTRAHLRAHQGTSQGPPGHISGPTRAHLRPGVNFPHQPPHPVPLTPLKLMEI